MRSPGTVGRIWQLLPAVRRGERDRFLFFFTLALLLSLAATLGLAGSEALFLARLGTRRLPLAFLLASLTSVFGSLVYALVVGRSRNDRLFVTLLVLAALSVLLLLERVHARADGALIPLFCLFYLTQALLLSLHYWTFATDFFDTRASRRLFPLFAVGASTGGMLGGALAAVLSAVGSSETLLLFWAGMLLASAGLIHLARNHLLRWAPIGLHEADESSTGGLRAALRYVRRSRLAFWLLLSVVGMVFALTLMQYIYLDVFAHRFRSPESLAAFFGVYLAATNAVEIGVGNALTPWLIRRFGVARANLAHPMSTLLAYAALALDPRLYTAILARANRELLENALAGPIRSLSYNALPLRFRGRMRALLEGVVFFAAMSLAGALLIALGSEVDPVWIALAGGSAALLYAAATLMVRREYVRGLVEEIRYGRLDLGALAGRLDPGEIEAIARRWQERVEGASPPIAASLLDLVTPLVRHQRADIVVSQLRHPDPSLRLACVRALAEGGTSVSPEPARACLEDADPRVRRASADWMASLREAAAVPRPALRDRLIDPDPGVRAAAAAALGPEGRGPLRSMLARGSNEEQIAALSRLPREIGELALGAARHPAAAVREAALDCALRLGLADRLETAALLEDLGHARAGLRRVAAASLARHRDRRALEALGEALDDSERSVRDEALRALAACGDDGALIAAEHARGPRIWTVDAALGVLAHVGGSLANDLLAKVYRDRVEEAWDTLAAEGRLPEYDVVETRFLRFALRNARIRACRLAFRALERIEDREVVRSVERALQQERERRRSDALEVLSNLGDPPVSARFARLFEDETIGGGSDPVSTDPAELLARCAHSADPWVRRAAHYCLGSGRESLEDLEERAVMERLLALQSVPLFASLSLEQLEVVNRMLRPAEFLSGEVVVREGDPGDELWILTEGTVACFKGWDTASCLELSRLAPIDYFGEMAVLDDSPRSVTVVAQSDCRLLSLAGARFRELILQAPEIAFEIFPVLTRRIRTAEARLEAIEAS